MTSRSILVTGASRGIGAACAARLQAEGHRVAGLSRSGSAPEGVLALRADLRSDGDLAAAIETATATHGPIEILVANAGQVEDGLAMRMSVEQFERVVDVNLTGCFRAARLVLPGMARCRFGRLVFVSSIVALTGGTGQANYAASKAGLIGFARSLAQEYGARGITSNAVLPGFIDTDMTAALPESLRTSEIARVPTGRSGTPDDVAAVVSFLCGEDASYVNGALVAVDGGLALGH